MKKLTLSGGQEPLYVHVSFYLLWERRITARFSIRRYICSVLWSRLFQFGVILAGSKSKLELCVGISKEVEKLQFSWLENGISYSTVKRSARYNERFFCPSISKMYEKEPRYNET